MFRIRLTKSDCYSGDKQTTAVNTHGFVSMYKLWKQNLFTFIFVKTFSFQLINAHFEDRYSRFG